VPKLQRSEGRRSALCGTFPGVTPGRRYRPSCPAVLGLSSRLRCARHNFAVVNSPGEAGHVEARRAKTGGHPDHFAGIILTQKWKVGKGRGKAVSKYLGI